MTAHTLDAKSLSQKPPTAITALRSPKEAAQFLKLSTSWLAKARMRRDGPPYIKFGRVDSLFRSGLIAMDQLATTQPYEQRQCKPKPKKS